MPWLLILDAYGLVIGRRLSDATEEAPEVGAAGWFVNEEVVDGNLVTSGGLPNLSVFMREFLRLLRSSRQALLTGGRKTP